MSENIYTANIMIMTLETLNSEFVSSMLFHFEGVPTNSNGIFVKQTSRNRKKRGILLDENSIMIGKFAIL